MDQQEEIPFGVEMYGRIVEQERSERKAKEAGRKVLYAVAAADEKTLPEAVREARKAMLDQAKEGN
jgi:hypothetical protein